MTIDADLRGVTPRYFETMQIRIVQGRAFTAADDSRGGVAIVDETFARRVWPGESAVGKRIFWMRAPDAPIEVVGVAGHKAKEGPSSPKAAKGPTN